jgi:choline dehydrogenase
MTKQELVNLPTSHVDHVIVGAGTAGCLLANRLSAASGTRVALLEAGDSDRYAWIHIPVGYLYCIGNPRTDWCFQTEPSAGLNGRRLRYPRGKVMGGCSSINGMIYMRGQSRDYDHWATLTGDMSWSWQSCLADFKRHEDHWQGPNNWHGAGGEWRIEQQRLSWPVLDAFAHACEQAGIAASTDFNRGNNEGVGYFEVNQRNGWRWNTVKAFLRPIQTRGDLQVFTRTQALQLELEPQADPATPWRCTGVRVRRADGSVHRIQARLGVVLACGAVGTPHLLEVSGLGAPHVLARAGLALRHALPGVGENLQDHLQIRAVFGVNAATRTLNTQAGSWWGKAGIAWQYLRHRSGPMSMAPSQLGAFAQSSPGRVWPNVQFHVQPLSLDAFGEPLHRFAAITASVCNLNPTSRGSVHARSADASVAPAIAPNYLATDEDRLVAAQSLRLTRRIAQQPALAPHAPTEIKPGVQFQSDEDLARLAGDIGTTIFHPVGTCRMGHVDDPMAVVDARLRVRGVHGLRIADASIMPTITSGNTASPTLMIAERAARLILEDSACV